ncbi:MAG: hypothetical protein IJV44_03540 [Prevotella sp.]|nr:hypothetical protein [Prevotella sp.]MBR1546592.1 hypothetical protein [Prevotella sp.]
MLETKYYKVAEHLFGVTAEADDFELMKNYEPFCCDDAPAGETAFAITIEDGEGVDYTEELRQDDEGQEIICGKTADGRSVFEFSWLHQTAGFLVCSNDYREGTLIVKGQHRKLAIDNTLMVLYALATAAHGTALFHSAVVSHEDKAYMFLGKSGTGKSTHARLWLKYISGTALVNDDNPVVRVFDKEHVIVYGSPWSGKTPCYRNVSYPLGGIILLSQAPYNKIRHLRGIEAYAALVPSISGKRWDSRIADGLHQTENALAQSVRIWHLECLPDEEAAKVCQESVER